MKANQGDYTITINGKKLKFKDEDAVPRISDKGLPVISTDILANKLGAQLVLAEGTIRLTVGSNTLISRIGDMKMQINGSEVRADGLPYIVAGRMYLPAVQACTLLGYKAAYDAASTTLAVSK